MLCATSSHQLSEHSSVVQGIAALFLLGRGERPLISNTRFSLRTLLEIKRYQVEYVSANGTLTTRLTLIKGMRIYPFGDETQKHCKTRMFFRICFRDDHVGHAQVTTAGHIIKKKSNPRDVFFAFAFLIQQKENLNPEIFNFCRS